MKATVCAEKLMMPRGIIDSIVHDGPAGLGHKDTMVVTAVGFESRRLGLSVVDIDAAMRRQCTHLNSQARGDIIVRS